MSLVAPGIAQLQPYDAGKPAEEVARELGVANAIKLASNENPLGPSPLAIAAAGAALANAHRYPDARGHSLHLKLAQHHGVEPEQIVLGNGSNELIELLVRTFVRAGEHVVFAEPSFVVYRMICLAHGVAFEPVALRDGTHDLDALLGAIRPETRLVFICNPNNPTGTHVSGAALVRFLAAVPPEVIVALDEAYYEYVTADDYQSGLALRAAHERLVVLRTFSKIYGLAAFRVGYAVAPSELTTYLERVRAPFNVNALAQAAALAALDDADHVRRSIELNTRERRRVGAALAELGLRVLPSQANYIYFSLNRLARPVFDQLLARGIIVRPFAPLPRDLRATVGTEAENDCMLEALREVLK